MITLSGPDPSQQVRTTWSTSDVEHADAATYWADLVCDTLVRVASRPLRDMSVTGTIEHAMVDNAVGLTSLTSSAQAVERTRGMIGRDRDDHVLVNIQIAGQARLAQNGRVAVLRPGSMAFVDSTRPYSLRFESGFTQLVVRLPRAMMSPGALDRASAIELGTSSPGHLVAEFLLGVNRLHRADPIGAAGLIPHAIALLDSALSWASDAGMSQPSAMALTRERIHRFVRLHSADPDLDVDTVAAACGVSRRTLFRALAGHDEPLVAMVRRVRVVHAQQLLRANPTWPTTVVAHRSGFLGEAQLRRAFLAVVGVTPAAYRGMAAAGAGADIDRSAV